MTYKAKGPKNQYGDSKEYTVGYTVETDCHKSSYDGKLIGTARIDFYAREIEKEDQWTDKTWRALVTLHYQCNSELLTDENHGRQYDNLTYPCFEKPYTEGRPRNDDKHFWSHWYADAIERVSPLGGHFGSDIANQIASVEIFAQLWKKVEKIDSFRNFSKAYPDGLRWLLLSLDAAGVEPLEYDAKNYRPVERRYAYVTA